MKDLLIFPFGGNARELLMVIHKLNKPKPIWNILGFIDDNKELWGSAFNGIKVLGGHMLINEYSHAKVIAVPGNPDNYFKRAEFISKLNLPINRFATLIDPSASIAPDSQIGKNTVIMANAVINCSVTIGDHCVILPNTVVSHDSKVGDYTLIGSNVSISGRCDIGQSCYIGSGSRIKNDINMGNFSLAGIGSCVIHDVPGCTVVAGNPARVLRNITIKQALS